MTKRLTELEELLLLFDVKLAVNTGGVGALARIDECRCGGTGGAPLPPD